MLLCQSSYSRYSDINPLNRIQNVGVILLPTLGFLWLLFGALADLMICASLSSDLWNARSGNIESNSFISSLVLIFVRNGALLAMSVPSSLTSPARTHALTSLCPHSVQVIAL